MIITTNLLSQNFLDALGPVYHLVSGRLGVDSVPDDMDESLATAVSSQPLSVSPEIEK